MGCECESKKNQINNTDVIILKVIFTIQNIDDEKRREEHLLRIALTDELTRLYNRRSYDEDIETYNKYLKETSVGASLKLSIEK